MMDFFSSILSFIEVVFDFFLNFVSSLVLLVQTIVGAAVLPISLGGIMWAPIATSITAVAGFAVVKLLLGRSSV